MALDFGYYLAILVITILLWKATAFVFSQSNVPGPKGNWLTGQLFELMQSKDVIQTLHEWTKTYGPIVRYRPKGIFGPTQYLVSDADVLRQILVTNSFKYKRPAANNKFFSKKNLVEVSGKEHARMRKMVNPAFKVDNLKTMVERFYKKAIVLTEFWNNAITSKDNNGERKLMVQDDCVRLTLDLLGECILGYKFDSVHGGNNETAQAFNDVITSSDVGVGRTLFQQLIQLLPFSKAAIHVKEQSETVSKTIRQVVDNKRQEKNGASRTSKDLVDLFLEAVDDETGQGMSDEELISNLLFFIFAGQDTSSTALSWIFYFLAQHPDVQEKLRKEVKETLKEREVCWETYDSMQYLAAVINETLRLRTPAPFYRREAIEDDNISGYNVPSGSLIIISLYTLHRKPEYWMDPETFNPDRFLGPAKQNNPNNRFAFLPFSAGPLMCVGYRFALMEIKVIVATLIKKFSFSMVPGMSFGASLAKLIYKPTPSLQLLVQKIIEKEINERESGKI